MGENIRRGILILLLLLPVAFAYEPVCLKPKEQWTTPGVECVDDNTTYNVNVFITDMKGGFKDLSSRFSPSHSWFFPLTIFFLFILLIFFYDRVIK